MKNCLKIILIVVFLSSCSIEQQQINGHEYTVLNITTFLGETVNLSRNDIIEIESIIGNELEGILEFRKVRLQELYSDSEKEKIKNASDYIRQYYSYIDSENQQIVNIKFACKTDMNMFKDWKTKPLGNILDGGSCFFDITVNFTTKNVIEANINSVALL